MNAPPLLPPWLQQSSPVCSSLSTSLASSPRIAIVGGGITGLTVGYHLAHANLHSRLELFEAKSHVGGRVRDLLDFDKAWDLGSEMVFLSEDQLRENLVFTDDLEDFEATFALQQFTPSQSTVCEEEMHNKDEELDEVSTTMMTTTTQEEDASRSVLNPFQGVSATWIQGVPRTRATWPGRRRHYSCQRLQLPAEDVHIQQVPHGGSLNSSYVHRYLLSKLQQIHTNTPVTHIDYSSASFITLTLVNGTTTTADIVVLALPIRAYPYHHAPFKPDDVVNHTAITLTPPLPVAYQTALQHVPIHPGLRVWLEFHRVFHTHHPDSLQVTSHFNQTHTRTTTYFNARFAQTGDNRNQTYILTMQETYTSLDRYQTSPHTLVADLLAELDGISDGQASTHFLRARVQNWSREEWIGYTFMAHPSSTTAQERTQILGTPLAQGRLWIVGEFCPGKSLGSAQAAAQQIVTQQQQQHACSPPPESAG